MELEILEEDIDGNYLIIDIKMNTFIRSGCAEMGMNQIWVEDISSSKLTTSVSRKRMLYIPYHHTDTRQENIPVTMYPGNFQQLEPMICVRFMRNKNNDLLKLFEPDKNSKVCVGNLNGIGDCNEFTDKWYRHICYYCLVFVCNTD